MHQRCLLRAVILDGKEAMPGLGGWLSAEEIDALGFVLLTWRPLRFRHSKKMKYNMVGFCSGLYIWWPRVESHQRIDDERQNRVRQLW